MAAGLTQSKDFVISRVFDAPRDLVWKCVHRSGAHEAVVGPQGLQGDRLQNGSARRRHLPLRHAGAGRQSVMWGKFVYREIVRRSGS